MNLEEYKTLISSLPVKQQSFTTKRKTWQAAESEIEWLADFNNGLFNNEDILNISRQDIFNSKNNTREVILKTVYWGYSNGMRGRHFVNILKNIEKVEVIFNNLKNRTTLLSDEFKYLATQFKDIAGLGLSTYSKLLYFFNIKFNEYPCLILDQRLLDVFNTGCYSEYSSFKKINDYNKEFKYISYIETTNNLALKLQVKEENIEQFLFMFGNNLKNEESIKEKISPIWNGYCPESLIKGKIVRMRLNHWDFYESEETQLQVCLNGLQAIILKIRGNGKYRSTPNFADEIESGQILSPQITDRPPFNNSTVVFENGDEIENYIMEIKG